MTQKTYYHKRSTIDNLLSDPLARQLALLVTFETMSFGSKDDRVAAWSAVKKIAMHCQSEAELNRWWRFVMPDASWKTADELMSFADWKIADIQGGE